MTKKAKTIILGIDPGTKVTGYGVICIEGNSFCPLDFGCIRVPQTRPLSFRYRIIFESIGNLIEKFSPEALAIEAQFVGKNPSGAIKLGMAKGMAVLAASLKEIPVFEYAPTRAKLAIVGNGRASKVQVQKMIKALLSLSSDPKPQDAADALAIAICHGHAWNKDNHQKHKI